MKRPRATTLLAIGYLLSVAACSSASADRDGAGAPADSAPASWDQVMERIGEEKDFIESQFLGSLDRVDLPRVADSARHAAELLALGYGPMEDPRVEGFAAYARAAEAWMLQLAMEADAGRAELARDLLDLADEKHCVECHEAADKVKW